MRPITDEEHRIEDEYQKTNLRHLTTAQRQALACSTDSIDTLLILSNDLEVETRCSVARNKHVSVELLDKLMEDPYYGIRYWVIKNSLASKKWWNGH